MLGTVQLWRVKQNCNGWKAPHWFYHTQKIPWTPLTVPSRFEWNWWTRICGETVGWIQLVLRGHARTLDLSHMVSASRRVHIGAVSSQRGSQSNKSAAVAVWAQLFAAVAVYAFASCTCFWGRTCLEIIGQLQISRRVLASSPALPAKHEIGAVILMSVHWIQGSVWRVVRSACRTRPHECDEQYKVHGALPHEYL